MKKYYAKPKYTMTGFNKGNLYEIDPECLEDGKPKADTLTLKDNKKGWNRQSKFDFRIVSCIFNEEKAE